jgi:hypothetical protein
MVNQMKKILLSALIIFVSFNTYQTVVFNYCYNTVKTLAECTSKGAELSVCVVSANVNDNFVPLMQTLTHDRYEMIIKIELN